jgi:hypothetical protein
MHEASVERRRRIRTKEQRECSLDAAPSNASIPVADIPVCDSNERDVVRG